MLRQSFITLLMGATGTLTGLAAPITGTGKVFETADMRYEIVDFEKHTLSLINPKKNVDFVIIPGKINVSGTFNVNGSDVTFTDTPFTVVQIGDNAFNGQTDLYHVDYPVSVISIGDNAFKNCPVLGEVDFPSNLEYIGKEAFKGCNSIVKIKLPETVSSIGEGAFEEMTALEKAVLLCNATEIKSNTFRNCKRLEQVYLPSKLETIGDRAFSRTDALDEIVFPTTLETIGMYAFEGEAASKSGLRHLKLPAGFKHLGEGAFHNASIITADLGESMVEIPEKAFELCYDLKEVKFPATLKRIGESAFHYCARNASRSMGVLKLPDSVEEIGKNAFFESFIISFGTGSGMTSLPAGSCGTPRLMHIGSSVTSIDVDAFSLEHLKLIICDATTPPSISASFNLSTQQAEQITVIVPDGCAELYSYHPRWRELNIIESSKSIVSVNLDGKTPLAEAIYRESGVMPSRVTYLTVTGHLSDTDFRIIRENMSSLCGLDIRDTDLKEISDNALSGMSSLERVVLPAGLKAISKNAFLNCSLMALEELPDGITSIGDYAFSNCSRITISNLPSALATTGYMAFGDCASIRSITAGPNLVDMGQSTFSSCDMLEYADLSKTRIKTLRANSFYIDENLQTIILPSTLEKIDYRALANTGLKTIELPGNISSYGEGAFYGSNLRTVTIGEGLTGFDKELFAECRKLVSVNLPSSLTKVGTRVFASASRLSAISCRAIEAPEAMTGAFDGVSTQKCVLTVPTVSFFNYLNAPAWGRFANIDNSIEVAMPDNIDATILDEEQYQEIMEEEELEKQAEENAEESGRNDSPAKATIRRARENTRTSLADGSQYCQLFGGATIGAPGNGKGQRLFIHPHNPDDDYRVLVNGIDMTNSMEGNSLLVSAGTVGKIEIVSSMSDVEGIIADDDNSGLCTIFSVNGTQVFSGSAEIAKSSLVPGIYIMKYASGHTEKIIIK